MMYLGVVDVSSKVLLNRPIFFLNEFLTKLVEDYFGPIQTYHDLKSTN